MHKAFILEKCFDVIDVLQNSPDSCLSIKQQSDADNDILSSKL